MYGIL